MAIPDSQLRLQNPWWTRPDIWEVDDPHLKTLASHPAVLPSPVAEALPLDRPSLHTLRGPRQVGKSTTLKLLARRALRGGQPPRHVIYMSLDLLSGAPATDLYLSVIRAKELARATGPCLLLLDEVTVVRNWDDAVKVLWDDGPIREDVVVCTGSSAIDLRVKAAERWPGRRGSGRDHLSLPYGFASFARALEPTIPESPGMLVSDLATDAGRDRLIDMQVHQDALRRTFELYLRFGGFPAAVSEAKSGLANLSDDTIETADAAMLKEIARGNLNEPSTHALLERVARALSSKTNWSALARDMVVPAAERGPTHVTVRNYLDTLAAAYFVLILYAWKADRVGNDLTRDKKLYFGDPLIAALAEARVPGLVVDEAALVENVVALTLLRAYEPPLNLMKGFHEPTMLHFWSTRSGGEIDFLAGPRSEFQVVECKYRNQVSRSVFNGMRVAFGNRSLVVATKDTLDFGDRWSMIPVPLFCWALANHQHP